MRTAALPSTSPWRPLPTAPAPEVVSAAGDLLVSVNSVEIGHHGSERNFRPYLRVDGQILGVEFPVQPQSLPLGITEVFFDTSSAGSAAPITSADLAFHGLYEFDDEEVAELVAKGYFDEGFAPPAVLTGYCWALASTSELTIYAPMREGDVPVVFVDLAQRGRFVFDNSALGFKLAERFTDERTQPVRAPEPALGTSPLDADYLDLGEVDGPLAETAQAGDQSGFGPGTPKEWVRDPHPDPDLEVDLGQVDQVLEQARTEVERSESALVVDPVEELYRAKVAPVVEAAEVAEEHPAAEAADPQVEPDETPRAARRPEASVVQDDFEDLMLTEEPPGVSKRASAVDKVAEWASPDTSWRPSQDETELLDAENDGAVLSG